MQKRKPRIHAREGNYTVCGIAITFKIRTGGHDQLTCGSCKRILRHD